MDRHPPPLPHGMGRVRKVGCQVKAMSQNPLEISHAQLEYWPFYSGWRKCLTNLDEQRISTDKGFQCWSNLRKFVHYGQIISPQRKNKTGSSQKTKYNSGIFGTSWYKASTNVAATLGMRIATMWIGKHLWFLVTVSVLKIRMEKPTTFENYLVSFKHNLTFRELKLI